MSGKVIRIERTEPRRGGAGRALLLEVPGLQGRLSEIWREHEAQRVRGLRDGLATSRRFGRIATLSPLDAPERQAPVSSLTGQAAHHKAVGRPETLASAANWLLALFLVAPMTATQGRFAGGCESALSDDNLLSWARLVAVDSQTSSCALENLIGRPSLPHFRVLEWHEANADSAVSAAIRVEHPRVGESLGRPARAIRKSG
jgi:hypothetical protein